MDYNLWVLSIYDEYRKEYEKKFPQKKFKDKFRELSKLKKTILILYIIMIIGDAILCLYGINKNNSGIVFLGVFMDFIITAIINSQLKVDFQEYKKRLKVFEEILIKENLNNIDTLKKLEKNTSSIVNNIFNKINKESIALISNIIQGVGIIYFLKKLGSKIILNIMALIIIIVLLAYLIYLIVISIPNNKYTKKKDMNELIKIYMVYKKY